MRPTLRRRAGADTVRVIDGNRHDGTDAAGATDASSEFIRGPKWRTRTSAVRRTGAVVVTCTLIVAVGLAVLMMWVGVLRWLDAPAWVQWLPWLVPTLGATAWAAARPEPAVLSDDDDDSWTGFAIRYVMVGEEELRPAPVRLLAAFVVGAPVVWSLVVLGLLSIAGIF